VNFCHNGIIYPKCGGLEYDPSRQTCNVTEIVDIVGKPKCNGLEYDAAASFCYSNTIYAKCGGLEYDPSRQTCNGTTIVNIPPDTPPKTKFFVYFNANGGMEGSDPPKTMEADSGSSIKIPGQQTVSRTGYTFDGWNTNASGTGTTYTANWFYTVNGDVTLYAKWTSTSTTNTTYTLTTSVSPSGGGTVSRSPNQTSYTSGTSVTVTATAASGYTFTGWSGASTSTSSSVTITMNGDKTLTANFKQQPTYTLTTRVSPFNGGSVSRSPDQTSYTSGASVTVTATAASGYTFTGWSGESTAKSSSVTITMNGDKTLTANFTQRSGNYDVSLSCGNRACKTVNIAGQTWMAENLNYQMTESWCYGNSADSCAKYGRLYTWDAAKAACPAGWHLPTRVEWADLTIAVGGTGTYGTGGMAGKVLKSASGWGSNSSYNGTDAYGFSALPGGHNRGQNLELGHSGYWWTAPEEGPRNFTYYRYMSYDIDYVGEDNNSNIFHAYSVRCLQD